MFLNQYLDFDCFQDVPRKDVDIISFFFRSVKNATSRLCELSQSKLIHIQLSLDADVEIKANLYVLIIESIEEKI